MSFYDGDYIGRPLTKEEREKESKQIKQEERSRIIRDIVGSVLGVIFFFSIIIGFMLVL